MSSAARTKLPLPLEMLKNACKKSVPPPSQTDEPDATYSYWGVSVTDTGLLYAHRNPQSPATRGYLYGTMQKHRTAMEAIAEYQQHVRGKAKGLGVQRQGRQRRWLDRRQGALRDRHRRA